MIREITEALNKIFFDREEKGFRTAEGLYRDLIWKILYGLENGFQDQESVEIFGTQIPMKKIIEEYQEWKDSKNAPLCQTK